jgi:hypothetical protein
MHDKKKLFQKSIMSPFILELIHLLKYDFH